MVGRFGRTFWSAVKAPPLPYLKSLALGHSMWSVTRIDEFEDQGEVGNRLLAIKPFSWSPFEPPQINPRVVPQEPESTLTARPITLRFQAEGMRHLRLQS